MTNADTSRITQVQFRHLVATMIQDGTITRRQADTIRLRAGGASWENIARILRCTPRTARTHHARACQKILDRMEPLHD